MILSRLWRKSALSGITKNSALWDQLNLSCLEQEKCWILPTKYHPYRQAGNENMLGGCFSAKRAGRLHRTERPMDGTMYPKIMRISFPAARRLKVDHRWVFRQWPITPQKYRQYNTTKEQLANPQTSTLLKKSTYGGSLSFELLSSQETSSIPVKRSGS